MSEYAPIYRKASLFPERQRGDNGLLITLVPKDLNNVFLFVDLTTLGTSVNYVECLNVSITNFNHWKDFLYRHWGITSIYRPLSNPFRSLVITHL